MSHSRRARHGSARRALRFPQGAASPSRIVRAARSVLSACPSTPMLPEMCAKRQKLICGAERRTRDVRKEQGTRNTSAASSDVGRAYARLCPTASGFCATHTRTTNPPTSVLQWVAAMWRVSWYQRHIFSQEGEDWCDCVAGVCVSKGIEDGSKTTTPNDSAWSNRF